MREKRSKKSKEKEYVSPYEYNIGLEKEAETSSTPDAIKYYVNSIKHLPLRSKEEIIKLTKRAKRAKKGDTSARDEIVKANLRLVISIAKKHLNHGLSFEDLIQEGNLGLFRAIRKYNPNSGFAFSTYATWWIRQSMEIAIPDKGRLIRVPVHVQTNRMKIGRFERSFFNNNGRVPTMEEVAIGCKLSLENVLLAFQSSQNISSLDNPLKNTEEATLMESLADNRIVLFDSDIYFRNAELQKAVEKLPKRERNVVLMRFGVTGGSEMTLEEIGRVIWLTRERVRQIETKAFKKLRMILK